MWFKNIQFFQLSSPIKDAETLHTALSQLPFRTCLPTHKSSHGWVSPVIHEEENNYLHVLNGYMLFCLQVEEKILPASVIKKMLQEKIQQIKVTEGREVKNQEKNRMREQITQELLPLAFSKINQYFAYVDKKNNYLYLNTTRPRPTELFLDALKKCIPQLTIAPPSFDKPILQMTHWLQHHNLPKSFSLEKSCLLQDPKQQGRMIRCAQQNLSAEPIRALVSDGCAVKEIALSWSQRIKFLLTHDFHFRQIKFAEQVVQSMNEELDEEDKQQQFNANFLLMTATFREIMDELLKILEN